MKKALAILVAPLFLFALSCKKSGDSANPPNPAPQLKAQLSGKWNVVKYVAANFDTTGGNYISNDTIYPSKPEYLEFSADSLHSVSWETFVYDQTTHPHSFRVTQTVQFDVKVPYTSGDGYYVTRFASYLDTCLVVSISSSQLVQMEKFFPTRTGVYSYSLYTYLQR